MATKREEESEEYHVARVPTPFHDENGVSKGWQELERRGWVFRSTCRPPMDEECREKWVKRLDCHEMRLPDIIFPNSNIEIRFFSYYFFLFCVVLLCH